MIEKDISLLIKKRKWRILVNLGEPAVEPLLSSLGFIRLSSMRFVLATLSDIGDPRAIEMFIILLESKNRFIACSAAVGLGKIKNPGSVDPLIRALNSSDKYLRRKAANALGKIGDPRATEALTGCLTHPDKFLQHEAAQALICINETKAIIPLIGYLLTRHSFGLMKLKLKTIKLLSLEALQSWAITIRENYNWRTLIL